MSRVSKKYLDRYSNGDSLSIKDINNIKIALNYFLKSEGFEDDLLNLESDELYKILNRQSEIEKLENESDE